jgi:cytoskeleton protein RodZ
MVSINLSKEPAGQQPNEIVFETFRDIGQVLAEARREQNLTIQQVAEKIHIRQQYLVDLEEGQLSDLPGRVYILGFIRTYARLLNLDGEELIRRLKELPKLPNYQRSQVPMPMHAEEEPSSLALVISAIVVVTIAIGGYVFLKPAAKISPPLDEVIREGSKTELAQETPLAPLAEEEKSESQPPKPLDGEFSLNNNPSPGSNDQTATLKVLEKKLLLKAKEPSWIEIRDEAGRVIFMKVLKVDEEYVVPEKPGITISTGNAGGLDIFLGDTKLPPLGGHGDIKRGIRLETIQ